MSISIFYFKLFFNRFNSVYFSFFFKNLLASWWEIELEFFCLY